jgi:hypothetical protein
MEWRRPGDRPRMLLSRPGGSENARSILLSHFLPLNSSVAKLITPHCVLLVKVFKSLKLQPIGRLLTISVSVIHVSQCGINDQREKHAKSG